MLRALAHPLRLRLLDLLRADGPATATGLGRRVGESSGTTSWHLRQLAEAGLVVEDTGRGSRRERWWRAAQERLHMRAKDFIDDPELAGPLDAYLHALVEQRYQAETRFVAELPEWIEDWHDKATFSDGRLSLTPDEAAALSDEILQVVERYRRDRRPDDATVVFHWAAFPRRSFPGEADND
ncbi:transcriptional regulator [Amycolatopsis bartoniae]|uniref:Transcriptional regulator n=2 Tax=Amycolatopsis bartoniae TaxID=941986 RepID=A0A8H9M6X0_9PSEU|nr:transcriptional regulator [Amycolatopsis bartoniae]